MVCLAGFDAEKVEPKSSSFDPVPNGKYRATITASESKPTARGNGEYLELEFQIVEGQFQGRRLWARLNRKNSNPKAVELAEAELSAICRATGVLRPNDSCELHNIPLVIDVRVAKRNDTGEPCNEIRGYEAIPRTVPAWTEPTR